MATRAGRVIEVNPDDYVSIGYRDGHASLLQFKQAPAALPVLVYPTSRPVYAGDVGPGTWVVELPGRVVPVTVPLGAVAVLAGCLSPYAYVVPVRPGGAVASEPLQSIA